MYVYIDIYIYIYIYIWIIYISIYVYHTHTPHTHTCISTYISTQTCAQATPDPALDDARGGVLAALLLAHTPLEAQDAREGGDAGGCADVWQEQGRCLVDVLLPPLSRLVPCVCVCVCMYVCISVYTHMPG